MKTYIVSTVGFYGHWGRGDSLLIAAKNCKKSGGKNRDSALITIVLNDPDASLDCYGYLSYGGEGKLNASSINVGYSTLGGLLKPIGS